MSGIDVSKGKIFEDLVKKAVEFGASDIHLTSGKYVTFRVKGSLNQFTGGSLIASDQIWDMFDYLKLNRVDFERNKYKDFGVTVAGVRLRVHFYDTLSGIALSIRLISAEIPLFDDLNLPDSVLDFTKERTGLVIVTGATGSGKSTTLASLINHMNKTQSKKIITVEDPIEYIFKDEQSMIIQRELGSHVNSFDEAIIQAMREDPDVLMVGELRDLHTIQSALRMAETGHLVFGTLHTRGAAESFSRIIDVFPGNQQDQIRNQLANVTKGVISQQLITSDEGERLPLIEVLKMNTSIAGALKNSNGNISTIRDSIKSGYVNSRMQTFYQSAGDLIKAKKLTIADAGKVLSPDDIKALEAFLRK